MRKCIGQIILRDKRLKYYVTGNPKNGYGVAITQTSIEKAEQVISKDYSQAFGLAMQLHRCSVFPGNLSEITEDCSCEE